MKITLNGIKWNVSFVMRDEEPDVWGLTVPSRLEIIIRKDLAFDAIRTTVVHEVVHALLFSLGFAKIDGSHELLFSEEQTCDFIAMNIGTIHEIANRILSYMEKKYNIVNGGRK